MLHKVAIHSIPRSGSTWLGQIFNSHPDVAYRYQPLFSFAFKGRLNENSSRSEINSYFQDILSSDDEFLHQTGKKSLASNYPVFNKNIKPTHIIYKEVRYHHILKNMLRQDDKVQVIGLVRNPMAALNSWINSPREFRIDLGWDPLSEWRSAPSKNQGRKEEYYGYDKWKEVALLFLQLQEDFPDNFLLVKYNELLKDPIESTQKLFSFVGLDMTSATEEFLVESRKKNDNETYGIYRSHKTDDQWKELLDQHIVDAIHFDLKDTVLEQFLH